MFRCDFCGKETDRVRRIALDRGYDRLGERHAVRYACQVCSERKEAERQTGGRERRTSVDGGQKPL
jgi:hypothetical protein